MTRWKTEDTGVFDLLMKNFVGVYDTTKYHSLPFVYVGLVPLIFAILFFISRRVKLREKISFGLLGALIVASFYFEPLNLFWQGMHSPNMFLFRYSYLFSFLVIYLAVRMCDDLSLSEVKKGYAVILVLVALDLLVYFVFGKEYVFVKLMHLFLTVLFLTIYFIVFVGFGEKKFNVHRFLTLLLVVMIAEAGVNTHGMFNGLLSDWNYASRSLYSNPHNDIQKLVNTAESENKNFYRLENLNGVSANDGINFGYSGVSFFSSIRNRHSSGFLDKLGFRSQGTNLNIRYDNNTLLMDSLVGMKYNINNSNLSKFGFRQVKTSGNYRLYKNEYALPLAMMTNEKIYNYVTVPSDNLASQKMLYNTLADTLGREYFVFQKPTLTNSENVKITLNTEFTLSFKENEANKSKVLYYTVHVPAATQAYISLFPTDMNEIGSSSATVSVPGHTTTSQMDITGQYYNIGYYKNAQDVAIKVEFTGSDSLTMLQPKVLCLDTNMFKATTKQLQKQGLDVKTSGRTAEMTVNATEDNNVVYTTIPYDKGWNVKIDGKPASVKPTQNAFLTVKVPTGKHTVKFSYLPVGFKEGAICFVLGVTVFSASEYLLYRRKVRRFENENQRI
jgi:uncharacterized membrane protein YfhO